eukprot:scaffold6259_cov75-Skeletonema_marinoi.AAC.14
MGVCSGFAIFILPQPVKDFDAVILFGAMAEMSEEKVDGMKMCCASCGIAEVDAIKLKECTSCDLVRYCSDKCQKNYISQHEEACKKRMAELHDELLFKQPESRHDGDCPICMIPLQLDPKKSTMKGCCSKLICNGCDHANNIREWEERRDPLCPFCRQPVPTEKECNKNRMKRVEANDPVAITNEGFNEYEKGDYIKAVEYFTKAAELGDAAAHYQLSNFYYDGYGVKKDRGKRMHHLEEAAIGGHPIARYNLGIQEWKNGHTERAVKHWIIAASQGDNDSLKYLIDDFKRGFVGKEDLDTALRAHHSAVDAAKSPQREAAEKYY